MPKCQRKIILFVNFYFGFKWKIFGGEAWFVETKQYSYDQFSKEFISHLSIIDVLMHNGKEGTKKLIENYNLI